MSKPFVEKQPWSVEKEIVFSAGSVLWRIQMRKYEDGGKSVEISRHGKRRTWFTVPFEEFGEMVERMKKFMEEIGVPA